MEVLTAVNSGSNQQQIIGEDKTPYSANIHAFFIGYRNGMFLMNGNFRFRGGAFWKRTSVQIDFLGLVLLECYSSSLVPNMVT
jgi:hypothetical protein